MQVSDMLVFTAKLKAGGQVRASESDQPTDCECITDRRHIPVFPDPFLVRSLLQSGREIRTHARRQSEGVTGTDEKDKTR